MYNGGYGRTSEKCKNEKNIQKQRNHWGFAV